MSNIYGRIFARKFLSNFHFGVIIFMLHGLGYDNCWKQSFTGEDWFIKKYLKKRNIKLCIDVGANIGNFSKNIRKNTDAAVYAFEPAELSFKELQKIPDIHCMQAAVADYDGETFLYSKADRSETASLDISVQKSDHIKKEQVKVMTLNTFFQQYKIKNVDFLKIDTEGFEVEVLRGMGTTVRPDIIQFEFNVMHLYRGRSLYDICNLLPEYDFYRLLPKSLIKIDQDKFINNIFMFSNFVAIKKEK